MPLTPIQANVLALLADNRRESSHVAGATGIHLAASSPRRSDDLDLFHDHEKAVSEAYARDHDSLISAGYSVRIELSQPGFIRAVVTDNAGQAMRLDWAHDSSWRFLPPVRIQDVGYVLHPVDLAVNKILALVGRDEPRDFIDVMYLHEKVLPLGALSWAACGKDPGLNPDMILELLARKGRFQQVDVDRLNLAARFDVKTEVPKFRQALKDAADWIQSRPPEEAGCLYLRSTSSLFFAPEPDEAAVVHRGQPGGVLPAISEGQSFYASPEARQQIESFFERRLS